MNLSLLPTSGLTKHSILSPETHLIQRYAYEIKQPGQRGSVQGALLTPLDNWHGWSMPTRQAAQQRGVAGGHFYYSKARVSEHELDREKQN